MLAVGNGVGAEQALRRDLDNGGSRQALAPFLGESELRQGNLAEAERWLAAGDFAPDVAVHGYHMLGRLRMRQGDLPAAGRAFDRALAQNPDDPELWVDIGRLRWIGGEQVEARDAAQRAVAAAPDNPEALLFHAQLVRDAQGNAAALPLLERGLAATPDNADLLAEYAATLGEAGRAADMLEAVRKLSLAAPGDQRVLYLQAVLATRAGQHDLARSLIARSDNLDRKMPAAMLLVALIDMEKRNYASAAQALDTLWRMQPDNQRIAALLARALALGGNNRELVVRFSGKAATPYIAALIGRAYEALGEREKAAPFIDAAMAGGTMKLEPVRITTGEAIAGEGAAAVALTRSALGRRSARDMLTQANAFLSGHPGSVDALELAGDAALAAADPGRASQLYNRAASVRRTWSLAKKMVVALDSLGRRQEATALVERHFVGEPGNADAAVVLARRLIDKGDRSRAKVLIAYARAKGRNDPVLAKLVEG